MLRGLWHIRNVHFFCVQMKTNQLFRFRNLLLLVFISRMNLWLWRSVIQCTHAHGNKIKQRQPSHMVWEDAFLANKSFQCVWGLFVYFKLFFYTTTKNKIKTGFKKVWKHDFRQPNWPNISEIDYILMSVKDCCCSWSLGVLWNDFSAFFLYHFF